MLKKIYFHMKEFYRFSKRKQMNKAEINSFVKILGL